MIKIQKYLKPAENQIYSSYVAGRIKHLEQGTHYWHRLAAAQNLIAFKNTNTNEIKSVDHAIVYQDQFNLEAPATVCHPAPNCIAELMIGYIHPPIEAHHEAKLLFILSDGSGDVIEQVAAPKYRATHDITGEYVIDYRRCHDEVMVPLEYEQAIEWITQKDIPYEVWGQSHNKPQMAIIPRDNLPKDRTHRNNWKLKDLT
jgi:hypothetical protein